MIYTIETLLKGNETYNYHHRLHEKDVQKVNALVARIEASREQTTTTPLDGDAIICIHPDKGEITTGGRLEVRDQIEICVYPGIPFINDNLHTSTSGGDWWNWREEEFLRRAEYVGRESRRFKTWGRWGMCGDGAIIFEALTNVWRFTDSHFSEF